ncbi:MAG: hypothetical protein ACRDJX_09145 [Solirubrobacteraceae bacterium]
MRSIKLSALGATAAALLTLAPAAASAAGRHSSHRIRHAAAGACRATLDVAPRLITSGEAVAAYGHLSCRTAAEQENQTVTLYESAAAGGSVVAARGTTNRAGFYKLETAPLTANSRFHALAGSTASRYRFVKVAAQVTLNGPVEGSQLLAGRRAGIRSRVTFTGAVSPEDAGALVVLQREDAASGNGWHRIGLARVGAGGSFSVTHRFLVPGDANIRVLIRNARHNVSSPSNVVAYEISQAQNPALTIDASADPIPYGQQVTITGKADVSAGETVRLLERTARQGGFAPVAEVPTNASGEYRFPAQSPVYSTYYEVRGGEVSSAVLYEDVGDALKATLSPGTTIQDGQALKLEGSVSPEHAGHVIYLERENRAGAAFHVVEISTLTGASTYSIAHTLYTIGTSVFRVRIPGDRQNGGAVSQPFTIDVTPSSSSLLPPEAPGNSTLPPEGQV